MTRTVVGDAVRVWRLAGLLCLLSGCGQMATFACDDDSQCMLEGERGTCEASGVCAFPDRDCDSGRRYGDQGGALAGFCVGPDDGSGEDTNATTTSGSASATGSGDSGGGVQNETTTAGTGGGPNGPNPYQDCDFDIQCGGPDSECNDFGDPYPGCTPSCDGSVCPATADGLGTPTCMEVDGSSICLIVCGTGGVCPAGMVCDSWDDTDFIPNVCQWPD